MSIDATTRTLRGDQRVDTSYQLLPGRAAVVPDRRRRRRKQAVDQGRMTGEELPLQTLTQKFQVRIGYQVRT